MIRTGARRAALLAVAAALPLQGRQVRVPDHPGERLRGAQAVSLSTSNSACLEFPGEVVVAGLSDRLLEEGCEVVASGELAVTGRTIWRWARYRRLHVFGAEPDTPPEDLPFFPDSTREDELVLFTATAGADSASPVWHDRADAQIELIQDPFHLPLEDEAVLLVHRICVNGTGGCWDYPYELDGEGTITPLRMTYAKQVREALPEGWGPWKGIWLERDRLSAWAGVYAQADVNCCPSFLATARLRFEKGELKADAVIVEPDTGSVAWKVTPAEAFGYISLGTSEAELARRYGASQVRPADVYLAEGFCTPGTLVYPGTNLQVEVAWADSVRTRPAFVRTREMDGPWRTWKGVHVGISLDSLEAIAGEPLSFSGFGWDYGGGMTWEADGASLGLRLAPTPYDQLQALQASDTGVAELLGDRIVRSDHPLVRRLHIEVVEMGVAWAGPAIERDCE